MTKKDKIKVVIDANWYISACISRNSRRLLYYRIIKNSQLQIYYSNELIEEFEDVILREKFRKYISLHHVKRFMSLVLLLIHKVQIQYFPKVVRDEKDDYLLGICESCEADFLISGDKDLLDLGVYKNTTILTMAQFVNLLQAMKLK